MCSMPFMLFLLQCLRTEVQVMFIWPPKLIIADMKALIINFAVTQDNVTVNSKNVVFVSDYIDTIQCIHSIV